MQIFSKNRYFQFFLMWNPQTSIYSYDANSILMQTFYYKRWAPYESRLNLVVIISKTGKKISILSAYSIQCILSRWK